MNYHQEHAYAHTHSHATIPRSPNDPSVGIQLTVWASLTVLTCLALTLLDAWPTSTKRRLWEAFVYWTPSPLIYAVDFLAQRRNHVGKDDMAFRRRDFGNQQAKSDALYRLLGLNNGSLVTVVQRARRLSGLKVLPSSDNGPAGLGNWDNSCYQNSIIQGLASLPSFNHFLAQNVEKTISAGGNSTHDALKDIIGRLNDLRNEGKRLWTPSVLKSMNSWQQQDAQEYFSRIIDELDMEMAKSTKEQAAADVDYRPAAGRSRLSGGWSPNPFQGLLAQRVGCTVCGYMEGLSMLPFTCLTVNLGSQPEYDVRDCLDEYTALESIDGVECIKCTILRTKSSLQHVLLNMAAPAAGVGAGPGAGTSTISVQGDSATLSNLRKTVSERIQLIDGVCEAGDFSDPVLYKKCTIPAKGRVSSTKSKQAVIARAPDDLVIHVNRSIFDVAGYQRKNHARVRFPIDLDLTDWTLGSDCITADLEAVERWNTGPTESMLAKCGAPQLRTGRCYKLRAVITHYGGHENGHYIAYRRGPWREEGGDLKRPEERWYCFSDDVVSAISEDHLLSQGGVFMLFYEALPQTATTPLPVRPDHDEMVMDTSTTTPATASTEGKVAVPEKEKLQGDETTLDPHPQPSPTVLLDPATDSSVGSYEPLEAQSEPEHPSQPAPVLAQADLGHSLGIAPVMRTAGPISPKAGLGRRSSQNFTHSPSFVTAS